MVAECVNPLGVTRDAWRDIAAGHGARLVEVELVCTDRAAHRERAQTREVDIRGLRLPDWEQITSREYEPWDRGHLVIDTEVRGHVHHVASSEKCCRGRGCCGSTSFRPALTLSAASDGDKRPPPVRVIAAAGGSLESRGSGMPSPCTGWSDRRSR